MYCKCENVMMKNVRASKDQNSTMTIEDPHSEQHVTQNACLALRVYIVDLRLAPRGLIMAAAIFASKNIIIFKKSTSFTYFSDPRKIP